MSVVVLIAAAVGLALGVGLCIDSLRRSVSRRQLITLSAVLVFLSAALAAAQEAAQLACDVKGRQLLAGATELLHVVSWPLVAVLAIVVFRAAIVDKLPSLRELQLGAVKASFEKEARSVESRAEQATLKTPKGPAATPSRAESSPAAQLEAFIELSSVGHLDDAQVIAATSPTAAIMLAYRQLEVTARAAGRLLGLPAASPDLITNVLKQLGDLDEFLPVVSELRRLRNEVTHSPRSVSVDAALSFVSATQQVADTISRVALSRARHPSASQRFAGMYTLLQELEGDRKPARARARAPRSSAKQGRSKSD